MRRFLLLILVAILSLTIFSCKNDQADSDKFSSIIISKYYETDNMSNNVIELFNNSDQSVNLDGLFLDIYSNGAAESDYNIPLTGIIDANDYYVIARPDAINELLDIADLTSSDLLFNGNDMIALAVEDEILDVVGYYLSSVDFAKDATLIRMQGKYEQANVYDEGNFILYQQEVFEYLKNDDYPIKTMQQLLEGPQLDISLLEKPFVMEHDETIGGGGLLEVTLVSIADGDTASFLRSDNNQVIRVRYFYVDTPEVSGTHTVVQPWGVQASNFNKQYLLADAENKTIYLQTIEGLSVADTYGRFLALVWVDGELSNHVIVRNGLAAVGKDFSRESMSAAYLQVPYMSFLIAAQANAEDKSLGVMGGVDSCWDYGSNKPNEGTCTAYPNDLDWKNG